jgi:hypothetical protein
LLGTFVLTSFAVIAATSIQSSVKRFRRDRAMLGA